MERIALIGNYPPRKCGIATFMNDLNEGIKQNDIITSVIVMNDGVNQYDYPEEVEFEIEQNEITSYINAANFINNNNFDAVILQHEFGIFGGNDGRHITVLLERLRMPVVTTFHTILDDPTEGQRSVVNEIAGLSAKLVSISQKGIKILKDIYGIPPFKCVHIQHGVHETGTKDNGKIKQRFGIENRKILLTFGLLSRNKSIEVVINALPEVVAKYPEVVYIVLGATHPHVVKHDGEEYRDSLHQLVGELGLQEHVIFINRFVSNQELFKFLRMCDIYVIPYLGQKQISSGTLIYAMGAAKPVISTPFWYAEEMLADNRGILFDFNNSAQLSEKITYLLDNENERNTIARNAFRLAEQCYWPNVGRQYIQLMKTQVLRPTTTTAQAPKPGKAGKVYAIPPVNLNQLRFLTDYTGILQHARYNVPDRTHGYCIDDNARALILSVMLQNDVKDKNELYRLTSVYLSFIDYAYNPVKGRFRNFMSYDRSWPEDEGSEDSVGRTMWALGYTAAYTDFSNFYNYSNQLFRKGLENIDYISHPRALAYLILGLVCHARMHDESFVTGILQKKARQLSAYFDHSIDNEWLWFENQVTYANNRIPQALIAAGMLLKNRELADRGIKILDWLIEKQFKGNIFSPIGNNGWMTPEYKAEYDQQPLEAHGMLDACLVAEEYAKNGRYAAYAMDAFAWFTGKNDCSAGLYDDATGGCCDGLHCNGANLNQGAESTLSWLMSLMNISQYVRNKNKQHLYISQ